MAGSMAASMHTWTADETKRLLELVSTQPKKAGLKRKPHGFWRDIAKKLGKGFTEENVKNHYYKSKTKEAQPAMAKKARRAVAIKSDNHRLIEYMESANSMGLAGDAAWAFVAGRMGGRWTPKACHDRYEELRREEEAATAAEAKRKLPTEDRLEAIESTLQQILTVLSLLVARVPVVKPPEPSAAGETESSPQAPNGACHAPT